MSVQNIFTYIIILQEMINAQVQLKKWYFKFNRKTMQRALTMSGKIFEYSPLFQYLIFNNPEEHVLLNPVQVTYSRLKGIRYLWFGPVLPRQITSCSNKITVIANMKQLKKFIQDQNTKSIKNILFIQKYHENIYHQINQLLVQHNNKNVRIQSYNAYSEIQDYIENKTDQRQFPSFSFVTENNIQEINKRRFNIYWRIGGQNYAKARKQFISFMEYYIKRQANSANDNQFFKEYKKKTKALFRNLDDELKFYTAHSYYYGLLNNSQRGLTMPQDLGYFRFPLLRLFLSVNQLFVKQKDQKWRSQQFWCYRGCNLTAQQIQNLSQKIGHVIQLDGWISTSKSIKIAKNFGSTLVKIYVPATKNITDFFHSFASINCYSNYHVQQQILFNPLNFFRIIEVKTQKTPKEIILQFYNVSTIEAKHFKNPDKSDSKIKKLIENYNFQKQVFIMNRNQGEHYFKINGENSVPYYKGLLKNGIRTVSNRKFQLPTSQQFILAKDVLLQFGYILQKKMNIRLRCAHQKKIQLLNKYIRSNIKNCYQIFISTAFVLFPKYIQESIIFLFINLVLIVKMIGKNTYRNYIVGVNLARNLELIDNFEVANQFFQLIGVIICQNHPLVFKILQYIYLYSPLLFYKQFNHINSMKLNAEKYRNSICQYLQKNLNIQQCQNMWKKFTNNLQNIDVLIEFTLFYEQNYLNEPAFMKKLVFQAFQSYYQQIIENQTKINNEQIYQTLMKCLKIFCQSQQKTYISGIQIIIARILLMLDKEKKYLEVSIKLLKRFQQRLIKQKNNLGYLSFHVYVVSLKYLLQCYAKLNGISPQYTCSNLRQKFAMFLLILGRYMKKSVKRSNKYAKFLMLLNICEYNKITQNQKQTQYIQKILQQLYSKIKFVTKWQQYRYRQLILFK